MLGVHMVFSIDADLHQKIQNYCESQDIPISRAVNNMVSIYLTGEPRSEEAKHPINCSERKHPNSNGSIRKMPVSVHIDLDLVNYLEGYSRTHSVSRSSIVNRAVSSYIIGNSLDWHATYYFDYGQEN